MQLVQKQSITIELFLLKNIYAQKFLFITTTNQFLDGWCIGLYIHHSDKLKKNRCTLQKIRKIHGELTAAIHGHIVLIKLPTQTNFPSANYAIAYFNLSLNE